MPLLLEAIYQRYGYDFRGYAPASLKRRLRHAAANEGLASFSALQDRLLHDPEAMARFLDCVSVDVTAMFRDPGFHRLFRERIAPELRGLPIVRLWHAGCSTGEEVYSTAIVLREEGLLDRARIYATDLNPAALICAREAIFPIRNMQAHTANYQKAGGAATFSDYYTARGDSIILRDCLRHNIVWAEHNLVTDSSFNEFNVIFCRNVMIYFSRALQERVQRILHESLAMGGCLGLGRSESLQFTPLEDRYEAVSREEKWYRKVRP
jgi:chemotaxis protein methyltransferase CheR